LAGGLSLLGFNPMSERLASKKAVDTVEIARAIAARNAARTAKNFKESDRIRDELLAQGIQLKDGPDGTTWEIKR
jgi:cysteinyl-tRNA synthetase